MVKKAKRAKEMSVAEIDYVGYNQIMSTQLLIDSLRQLRVEINAVKLLASSTLAQLNEIRKNAETRDALEARIAALEHEPR